MPAAQTRSSAPKTADGASSQPTVPQPRLSAELSRLAEFCRGGKVTVRSLAPEGNSRAHALLALFLSVCFLHPIPMPGISAFFGLIIALAGTRMALGRGVWLPERWLDWPLPAKPLGRIFAASHRAALLLERFTRPRAEAATSHPLAVRAHGLALALCGILLAVPIPPPTNFPPAAAAALLSIAILERDAAVLAAGYLAFALNLLFFGAIAVFGWQGVKTLVL